MEIARAFDNKSAVNETEQIVVPLEGFELEAIAGGAVICNDD
jgi:hypothetical protein